MTIEEKIKILTKMIKKAESKMFTANDNQTRIDASKEIAVLKEYRTELGRKIGIIPQYEIEHEKQFNGDGMGF